jgi:hypothetical protein
MSGVAVHSPVAGSKIRPVCSPTWASRCPPATKIRPSRIVMCPAQKMFRLSLSGTTVNALVTGFQTCGFGLPVNMWSHITTVPFGARFRCTATSGHEKRSDQSPVAAGLPGDELENETVTGAES